MTVARRFTLVSPEAHDLEPVQAWRARDTRLERYVTVLFAATSTPHQVHRAMAATTALRHRGMVTTLATGMHEGPDGPVPFQVLSRAVGTRLDEAMARHVLPVDLACTVIGAVATTVADLHREDIVHGMLRPASVVATDSGAVVVTGWGLDRELALEYRWPRGTKKRDDAVSVATMFAQAVTGLAPDQIDPQDLPPELTSAQQDLITALVRGSGPTRMSTVVDALGAGTVAISPALSTYETFALTPAEQEALEARLAAEAARIAADAAAIELDADLGAVGAELAEMWEAERRAPRVSWLAVRQHLRHLTGGAAADADADSSVASLAWIAERQAPRYSRALAEKWAGALHRRWPDSEPLAVISQWAERRSHAPVVVNPGPLLIALFLTGLVITAYLAIGSLQGPWEPDFPRFNPEPQTYPAYTHEPVPTEQPSPSPSPS